MSDSPESVVRKFLSAWEDPTVAGLIGFFAEDAVYIAGPRGIHRGVEAIRAELESQLGMGLGGITSDVSSLVADGGTVMMERVDRFHIGGKPFEIPMMAAVELDADGRIVRYRESLDL